MTNNNINNVNETSFNNTLVVLGNPNNLTVPESPKDCPPFIAMCDGIIKTAEKYKNIDANMKDNINKVMALACNISKIFDMASATRKNELLQILISNCKLNGSTLEYTINAPFDKLIGKSYTEWTTIVVQNLDEFECLKV